MTELLLKGEDFDPAVAYSAENYPPVEVQLQLFRHAVMEGELFEHLRLIRGPHRDRFVDMMKVIEADLTALNPECTPEYIMPEAYQSPVIKTRANRVNRDNPGALSGIRTKRTGLLHAITTELKPVLAAQQVAPGVLNVPPYCKQREDWDNYGAQRACANACFRMVFGAIAGWTPSEFAVARALIGQYDTSIVDDSVLYNIFNTEVFKEICDRDVISLELTGADLDSIQKLASKVKTRNEAAEVFTVVSLASKNAGRNVWHTSVLLEADHGRVVYHDPSSDSGGARMMEPYDSFVERWAVAYNRAVMVIAA